MAKLTVKNVGPIREAEVEVKKHTVFIGPQGSGKSTLAKLIAICSDPDFIATIPNKDDFLPKEYGMHQSYSFLKKYSISSYLDLTSSFYFTNKNELFEVMYDGLHRIIRLDPTTYAYELAQSEEVTHFWEIIAEITISLYIPSERHLFPILSNAIWSLLSANVNIPEAVTLFGRFFEESRNGKNLFTIPFLGVQYRQENSQDLVYFENERSILLSESASGYQSIIPLLLVVEHQRRQSQRRFIIEEPELNLYPIAQKDLIYSLMGGLEPTAAYNEAEWVFTTHSPYVLTSFNTLILAYKVAQKSEELRAEVEKIIPSRCWINPDEFAAYYVDNGTVRSIISEKTGMIADNELDDVSDDFAGEQDQLLALSRGFARA